MMNPDQPRIRGSVAEPPLIFGTLSQDRLPCLSFLLGILLELNLQPQWMTESVLAMVLSPQFSSDAGESQQLLGTAQLLAERYRSFPSVRGPSALGIM